MSDDNRLHYGGRFDAPMWRFPPWQPKHGEVVPNDKARGFYVGVDFDDRPRWWWFSREYVGENLPPEDVHRLIEKHRRHGQDPKIEAVDGR